MRGVSLGVAVLCVIAAGAPVNAAAQGDRTAARPVDRILAIVGSKPILASQVEEQLVLAQAQGLKVPSDSAGREAARRQILTQMVEEELLVQQAERDTTIKVSDQEVQDQVEQTVQNVRKQFTAVTEFQAQLRAAGFQSEEEWRRWLADNQRRSILQQRLIELLRPKGKLRPGEISPPVESPFGYHIIRVERVQPAEVLARHVLIAPEISPAQIDSARRRAALVHDALAAGASFDSLARRYGDESEEKLADGLPLSQLPPDYQVAIGNDTVLGLKPVFEVGGNTRRPKFVVLEVTKRLPEGELTFEDVKDRIRESLSQQLA